MVRILIWGMKGSGKTTILKLLHHLAKEKQTDIEPHGNLIFHVDPAGYLESIRRFKYISSQFGDRGIFQSAQNKNFFYHVYATPGAPRFRLFRRSLFRSIHGTSFHTSYSRL